MLAIAALLAGRVFLGVGESFTATGATLWGSKPSARSTRHGLSLGTAWRPMWRWRSGAAGSYPQSLFWHQRLCYGGSAGRGHRSAVRSYPPDVKVTAGTRAPFHAVVRKIWPYGWAGLWHRRFRRYRHLYHPLLRRAQLAGRRVYPFAVQRRLYLRSRCWEIPLPALAESRSPPASSSKVSACFLSGWRHQHGWPASAPSHRFGFLAGLSGFRS